MNWRLSILSIFLMLSLSAELCSAPGVAMVKDQPHSVCVLDDSLEDVTKSGENGESVTDILFPWQFEVWLSLECAMTAIEPSNRAGEAVEGHAGIRLHRWLCVERC